jgi:murein DD-endopeptidase MepM/ murein hydrolase activator NlpD
MPRTPFSPRFVRRGAGRRRPTFALTLLIALAVTALAAPSVASAGDWTDRIYLPKRAPAELRAAELDAIGRRFARQVATDGEVDQEALARWLRYHGGRLGQLLAETGVEPARLVMGAITRDDAMGGPFVALAPEGAKPTPRIDMDRLVDRVLAAVPLVSPVVDDHRVTSHFGRRRDPFRGRIAFHRGIDLAAARGTPIYAPAVGTVVRAGRLGGYGNVVEIDHGNGVVTRYAHLHAYLVKKGTRVRPGDRIGRMGRSGRATGVHLHYEVMIDDRHVDPAPLLDVGRRLRVASR